MKLLMQCIAVGVAGFFGSIARLLIGRACGSRFGQFPVGTLVINISGSFFLGWFYGFAKSRIGISETLQLAIATGFVGAYTTFSTFMYESDALIQKGELLKSGTNIVGSLVLGLIAVRLGYILSR